MNDSSELSDALEILASEIEAIPLKLGDFAGTWRGENNDRGACTLRKVKYTLAQKMQMIRQRISILNEILEPVAGELEPIRDEELPRLILLWHQIAASFRPTLALMKHASFEEENEWRLVRTLCRRSVPTVEWPVQVRAIRGQLAPYIPISWALPSTSNLPEVQGIKEVRCGPSLEPELKEKAVHDLLIAQNCWGVPVLRSDVPLRA